MQKVDFSLVLPVHNQELIIKRAVADILKVLKKINISYEVILVENGSLDGTLNAVFNIAKEYPHIRVFTSKKGYGSAIITGLNNTRGTWVSYMPSDGQLDPKVLSKLYALAITGMYTMVKIRRVTRESIIRLIRSKIFNLLTRLFFKINVNDINGNPRIFLRKWLKILNLQYQDSFIDTEMAIKSDFLKWKVKEIPAKTLPRLGGKSTVSIATVIEFMRNLITYKFGPDLPYWLNKTRK